MTGRSIVVALVFFVAAGCGSGEPSATTSTTSTTASSGPSGTTTRDSPADPAPGTDIARFAGRWSRHGIGVTVTPSGEIEASYRTYKRCGEDPPPCDDFRGHLIDSGGHLVGRLELFSVRSAKVILVSDTNDLVIDDPAIFELLDDGKARLAGIILCGETTSNRRECGA